MSNILPDHGYSRDCDSICPFCREAYDGEHGTNGCVKHLRDCVERLAERLAQLEREQESAQ